MKDGKVFARKEAETTERFYDKTVSVQEQSCEQEYLCRQVIDRLDTLQEISDEAIVREIHAVLHNVEKERILTLKEKDALSKSLFHSLRKLDVLQELMEDPEITEIMVNGPNHIFYEKSGALHAWDKSFPTSEKLEDVIQQIVGRSNKMVNESTPIADTRLSDGSRINVVLPPIAIDGACVSIRRFPETPIRMEDLIEMGSISKEAADFLHKLVQAKYNIFISGGTGSGKTTFLNVLSSFIPKDERIITIEDSAELQIKGHPNLVRLETRSANFEGVREITIRDLIKTALRMRPDRIVVGEVRGEEALDMLQSMQSGHDGSLSTGHSNSAEDMLKRLETMVLMGMDIPMEAIRSQIAEGIDILVHLGRLRDKSRKVLDIMEITGYKNGEINLHSLYHFVEQREQGGKIIGEWKKQESLCKLEKWKAAGMGRW